jgi:hypothetical protein
MSLNMFVYGEEAKHLTETDVTLTGECWCTTCS